MKLTLFHYWRSSASWRTRWALIHKGIPFEYRAVDLLKGENEAPEHRARNPFGYVPALEIDEGGKRWMLTESLAILEWLEETHPLPSLYPGNPRTRAHIRQLTETINAGTQPLQNIGVLERVSDQEETRRDWARHFIGMGLEAFQTLSKPHQGRYSVGDDLTAADLCLIPQLYNARRFGLDLAPFGSLCKVEKAVQKLPSAGLAHPDRFAPKA